MKTLSTLFILLLAVTAKAQYTAVTHTSGSATYGAHTITVTGSGTASTYASWCGAGPYWIGAGTGSTPSYGMYTFTFSPAVTAFRVEVTAANVGESISVGVNGSHYSLTAANVFAYAGTCGSGTYGLSGDTVLCTSAGSFGANVGINVYQCSGITSCTIETDGLGNGSVFNFLFSDTSACSATSNNGPLCIGDTLKLYTIGTAGDNFAWSGPGGFTSTAQNPIRVGVTYADSGVYRVIKNSTDTSYTDFVVKQKPIITATSNAPICSGDNLLLDCGPDSTGETFSWVGPNSFTSAIQSPIIGSTVLADSGWYTVIATWNGCSDTSSVYVGINHVPIPTAANNTPVCEGSQILFTATDSLTGILYSWAGPGGYSSTKQDPTIGVATVANTGTYTVTVSQSGCSVTATTTVTVNPVPVIASFQGTEPTPCYHADGSITLTGLTAGISYSAAYTFNGMPVTVTVVADASGNVVITGLNAGSYTNISVTSLGCPSNVVGPVTLHDPGIPHAPTITSNSPVCEGGTLSLYASDVSGLTYSWAGPNSFAVASQWAVIHNVTFAQAGTYTVTVSNGTCTNTASTLVTVLPGVILYNVTTNQSIHYGGTVQLNASGADIYNWYPYDGSLSNPNINNPVATPLTKTIYTVIGMNASSGCKDTAEVTIDITFPDTVFIPTAFTPNGDGINDIFRVVNLRNYKLVEFNVFNRWGETIYSNNTSANQGWDGTYKSTPQEMGTYNYMIILANPQGENKVFTGNVTLIR